MQNGYESKGIRTEGHESERRQKNPYPVNECPSRSASLFKRAKVASRRTKCMIILFVGKLIR